MISPPLLSRHISYTFLQCDLFRILSQDRNVHSPVTVRKVKTRKKWFISAVSVPSSSEKTWEGSEQLTRLINWKLCKGRNYKGWGKVLGSKVLITKGGWHQREDSQPDPISLECLPSHSSLGNVPIVRCLTPRRTHHKQRAMLFFISKEKFQLANPVCLNPLSPVIIWPPGSFRLTHLSSLSVAEFHLSVWHLPAPNLKINSLLYELQTPLI